LPDFFNGSMPATWNFWGDVPPNPNKFQFPNGTVTTAPTYDGYTLPTMVGYNLFDMGFGVNDTVNISNEPGNDPAGNLFVQAYTDEMQKGYNNAITLYKQMVANYTNSNFCSPAVERIINCYQKKRSTVEQYSQLQSYMTQLKNTSGYPFGVRELAEDFILKTLIPQNEVHNTINDYDTMYNHNTNNSKGNHALVNKYSLMMIYPDTSSDHFNRKTSALRNKLSLLTAITGKQLILPGNNNPSAVPKEFNLYQNYPNPFNPTTTIKYDLPKDVNVTIKIYDIIGRVVTTLVNNEMKKAGSYNIQWNGANYASGVYFYRIEAGDFVSSKKLVLIK